MSYALAVAAVLLMVASAPAKAATPQRPSIADCVDPRAVAGAKGLFPTQFQIIGTRPSSQSVVVSVAQFFNVSYYDTFKVVTNNKVNETYVLYQCGTEAPALDSTKFPSDAKFFEIPLTKVSAPDTTSAAFLEALNILDRVAYVTTYVHAPCLQALSSSGCGLVSYGATSPNISNNDAVAAAFNYRKDSKVAKSIAFTATSDPGSLNRAEWIKFMSVFFNKEAEANTLFSQVTGAYNAIAAGAKQAVGSQPKTVAWIQWWGDKTVYGPFDAPSISISFPAYKAQLTTAAGAAIVGLESLQQYVDSGDARFAPGWSRDQVFFFLNQTDVLRTVLKDVDVVIDEARYGNVADVDITLAAFLQRYGLDATDVQSLKFLRNDGVLREDGLTNPGSYNEWFGRAVVRPDQVLSDLVQALYPEVLQQLGQLSSTVQLSSPVILRNVAKNQAPLLATPQQCKLNGCTLPATAICPYVYTDCNGSIVYATDSQRCAPVCGTPGNLVGNTGGGASATKPMVLAAFVAALLSMVLSFLC